MDPHPGRIIAFTSQLPSQGFGKLKKRDDSKLFNTEKENTLFQP
jgi:hypothetical protein